MPQGKSLNIGVKKLPVGPLSKNLEPVKASNDSDERYQYLLKRAIIRRVENDERVIFAELPGLPGVLVVYRKPSERNSNPERLNLDRRELSQVPLLEGEEKLRLLNYQHNFITKIENLLSLPNLIFLDLYNNQIKEINGLHTVSTLRVLMLGKNQIEKIKNLNMLIKLDVLDLHSNKIGKIENLNGLQELRVLNLANNQIGVMENLEGLLSLSELNLRRNFIEAINCGQLPKMQRLFLSNNKLENLESIDGLAVFPSLTELALDGNPISNIHNYTNWVMSKCSNLSHLDLKKITQEMRETVKAIKVEDSSYSSENLIGIILSEWKQEIDKIKHLGLDNFKKRKDHLNDSIVQSGHAEIEGNSSLFIYGNALEVISKPEFQDSVTSILFQYIKTEQILQNNSVNLLKKFKCLNKLIFSDNNLHSFIQLSKLESINGLSSVVIENNDASSTVLCRCFIVYRFTGVVEIDGVKVDENDKNSARQHFQNFDKILCTNNILVRTN